MLRIRPPLASDLRMLAVVRPDVAPPGCGCGMLLGAVVDALDLTGCLGFDGMPWIQTWWDQGPW